MTVDSLSDRLGAQAWSGAQSVEEVVATVRAARWMRTGFTLLMAGLSLAVMPLWLAAVWSAFIVVWEIWLRPLLEDQFA